MTKTIDVYDICTCDNLNAGDGYPCPARRVACKSPGPAHAGPGRAVAFSRRTVDGQLRTEDATVAIAGILDAGQIDTIVEFSIASAGNAIRNPQ